MKQLNRFSLILLGIVVFLSSCKKADPEPVNEQEKITRVTLTFTPQGGGANIVWSWSDPDGDGSGTFTTPNLPANKTYAVSLGILNELANPDEDIAEEVAEEAEEHQLFYVVSGGANLSFAYKPDDKDDNNKPVGLETTATAGAASTGKLRVILKHEGTKNATIGTPSTDGEDDFDLEFNVNIN
jgi:hypothetical protein